MANKELEVINSVLKNKDLPTLFQQNVDEMFVAYPDVWNGIKEHYGKYHALPSFELMQERHPDLEDVPVKASSDYYMDGLKEDYLNARIEKIITTAAAAQTSGMSASEILQNVNKSMTKLSRIASGAKDLDIMDFDAAERHYDEVRKRAEQMGGTPGIPTGIDFIDSAYPTGFAGGDLIVVLGWTGRAKSQFTTLLSANAHAVGHKPAIFSLEMSGEKVRDRIFTIMGKGKFRNSDLTMGDVNLDDFRTFRNQYRDHSSFYVCSTGGVESLTPNFVQSKISQHAPKIVTIDYAQLATDNANSPEMVNRMRNMSSEYKQLAVANDIPVVLISSATAENGSSAKNPPTIEQVAWSRQLAFDADLAFAVHKHDDSNIVEIVCRKNRNGPLFSGYLDWDINTGVYTEEFEL